MEVAGDESYASFLTEGLLLRMLQIVLQPEGNSPLSVVYGEIEEALPALQPFARGKEKILGDMCEFDVRSQNQFAIYLAYFASSLCPS